MGFGLGWNFIGYFIVERAQVARHMASRSPSSWEPLLNSSSDPKG
jgi:hypothetical protein